jgi:Protein of unknown function (DUF3800)
MAARLNKKIFCFVDEYGTAGATDLYLGAVMVRVRDAGRVEKCLSDLLEPNVNELHAVRLDDRYLEDLLGRFWRSVAPNTVLLLNRKCTAAYGTGPLLYAQGLVETTKIGLSAFQRDILGRDTINNVQLITDLNQHNTHPEFDAEIERSMQEEGRFKAVDHFAAIDSAASRLLQLADMVAHTRKWVTTNRLKADALRERFGIQTL